MQTPTPTSAAKWIADLFISDWALKWITSFAIPFFIYLILWIFGKDKAMNPNRRKYFFFGFFVMTFAVVAMAAHYIRHFDQQVEDIRNGSNSKGVLRADV